MVALRMRQAWEENLHGGTNSMPARCTPDDGAQARQSNCHAISLKYGNPMGQAAPSKAMAVRLDSPMR
jgi:hypothetical protein